MADDAFGSHLELQGIGKSYGAVRALDHVDLSVAAGTVHALVGENGAGKSTLGKIISGSISPDQGRLLLRGRPVTFAGPRAALEHGIGAITQELTIVGSLSVAENVLLGSEPRVAGVVRRRELQRRYEEVAATTGFELPGRRLAGSLRTAEKQQVEIMRALSRNAELIVMDEPTAALSGQETEALHTVIRRLAASGCTVVLVSHFLGEVLDLADEVTVLRDGRHIHTVPSCDETRETLIHAMLGRSLGAAYPVKRPAKVDAEVVLSVQGLFAAGVDDVTFDVRAGEIVGLAGLVGAGRSEVARSVCGAARRTAGTVTMAATGALGTTPPATRRDGVVMISESRKEQGVLPGRSVTENVTIAALGPLSSAGVVRHRRERAATKALLERVSVRASAASLPVGALSGGNQQKVLFARALMCRPRLLIADEPTRGVDVGSKRAIYDLIADLAAEGAGVVLISSELEEVLEVAHRVLVLRNGRIVARLGPEEMTEHRVLSAAFGDSVDPDQAPDQGPDAAFDSATATRAQRGDRT